MPTGPDLIATNFDFKSIYWVAGNPIVSHWDITNQGDAQIVSTTSAVYLSTDMTITNSDTLLVIDGSTGDLLPGETNDDNRPTFIVDGAIAPGTYYVGVIADPNNFRVEADETNNVSNILQVTVSASSLGADFITEEVTFASCVWEEGDMIIAEWRLINQGDEASVSVSSQAYLSTDANVTTSDLLIATDPDSGMMSPGENNWETADSPFTVTGLAPGIYYVAAFGDSNGTTAEIDENNNWSDVVQIQIAATATDGDDVIDKSLSKQSVTISGLLGNDELLSGSGSDVLNGNGGDDILVGGASGDLLNGGSGTNTASYVTAQSGLTADLVIPGNNTGDAGGDIYTNIQNLTGSAFDDILWGNFAANVLNGLGGNDMLFGRDGDDRLQGGLGDDVLNGGMGGDILDGGAGSNTVSYTNSSSALTVDLVVVGNNTGEAVGDVFSSIQNITGTNFADTLWGSFSDNVLDGGAGGADFLRGRAGMDTLKGNAGNDRLDGGADGDILDGGSGTDLAYYLSSSVGLTVDMTNVANNTGDAAGDTYIDIENINGSFFNDNLRGDAGDNVIIGSTGNDVIRAEAGNDILQGQGDNDVLVGGLGGDNLQGGAGTDMASYFFAATGVHADLILNGNNTGEAAGDTYSSIENIAGSGHDDFLGGTFARNVLNGFDGHDVLQGRGGGDRYIGGNGNDTFVFQDGFGAETVVDFDEFNSSEKINLRSVSGITDFADLVANHLSQVGAHAVITDGAGTITIQNALIGDLGMDDFLF